MSAAEVLRYLNFQFTKLIYGTNNVQVYAGTYGNYPVVFKVLSLPPNIDYQLLDKESQILLSTNHENAVKLYYHQWIKWGTVWYLVIVMEACDKDLSKDIKDRNDNMYPYSEQELWNMMITLVRAFAYMQRQGLAHRNIKPVNIFLSHGVIKIGDFGSARYLQADEMAATLIGTPIYLSPLLKEGLISRQGQVVHNVYKSDVYSLGLTLFALASLQPPSIAITNEDAVVKSAVWALNYGEDIKKMILWMLTWDEGNRPDFVTIDEWITNKYYTLSSATDSVNIEKKPLPEPEVAAQPASAAAQRELPVKIKKESASNTRRSTEPQHPPPRGRLRVPQKEVKYQAPRCMNCTRQVIMEIGSPVVQLKCSPNNHVYCSPECLSEDVKKQQRARRQLSCPTCREPIDEDDLKFYCVETTSNFSPICGLGLLCSLFTNRKKKICEGYNEFKG